MEISEIEEYVKTLAEDEIKFKQTGYSIEAGQENKNKKQIIILRFLRFTKLVFFSFVDFLQLYLRIRFNKKSLINKKFVYTLKGFCNLVDGKLVDRVLKPLFTDNIIFINHSTEIYLRKINDQRVYNLGGVVKLISFLYRNNTKSMRLFRAYSDINNVILKYLKKIDVYMLLFYNLNSLSIIFSKYRKNISLIEVQHGSIINYPPYVKPAPIKIADIYYVKNEPTIKYLKTHLCLNNPAEYRLIPYPKENRKFVPGLHVLYASTLEFNGLHPIMKQFLDGFHRTDLDLVVRLHPREKEKEPVFAEQLEQYKVNYRFDRSESWLEGNTIENLIVVTPWSSSVEDAYDNGFLSIIIDPVGRERYKHLIDNERCFYSDNLALALEQIVENKGSKIQQ